jgi:hypothetical protein
VSIREHWAAIASILAGASRGGRKGLPDSPPEFNSKTLAKWLGQTPQAAPFNQLAIIAKPTRCRFFSSGPACGIGANGVS